MVASKGRTVDAQTNLRIGNLLGAARAEVDSHMLERAFLDTSDFQSLENTDPLSALSLAAGEPAKRHSFSNLQGIQGK